MCPPSPPPTSHCIVAPRSSPAHSDTDEVALDFQESGSDGEGRESEGSDADADVAVTPSGVQSCTWERWSAHMAKLFKDHGGRGGMRLPDSGQKVTVFSICSGTDSALKACRAQRVRGSARSLWRPTYPSFGPPRADLFASLGIAFVCRGPWILRQCCSHLAFGAMPFATTSAHTAPLRKFDRFMSGWFWVY
jgi:hypothetical protein